MKALALALLSVAACSKDWSLARQDGAPLERAAILCEGLPALATDPSIDGKLEPGLALYSWLDAGALDIPPGISARLSLAFAPGGLYFFADVADPTRDPAAANTLAYCGDSVELFVDDDGMIKNPPGYDIPGTMQLIMVAPSDDVHPVRRGQRFVFPGTSPDSMDLGAWTSTNFTAVPSAGGYTVEALVQAPDLGLDAWTPKPGGRVGWDVSLNIGGPEQPGIDACTTRSQQVHFRLAASGACTTPYCNAAALCTPTLVTP